MSDVRTSIKQQVDTAAEHKSGHIHEWKRFKETVKITNNKFTGRAYFVVRACVICHEKQRITYVVEKG